MNDVACAVSGKLRQLAASALPNQKRRARYLEGVGVAKRGVVVLLRAWFSSSKENCPLDQARFDLSCDRTSVGSRSDGFQRRVTAACTPQPDLCAFLPNFRPDEKHSPDSANGQHRICVGQTTALVESLVGAAVHANKL